MKQSISGGFTRHRMAAARRPAAYGKRLDQAGFPVRDPIVHPVQRVIQFCVRNPDILGKSSDRSRSPGVAGRIEWIGIHPFADFKLRDIFSFGDDPRNGLVSEFSIFKDTVSCGRAMLVYGNVRTADTGINILNQHIIIVQFRNRQFTQIYVVLSPVDSSFHRFLFPDALAAPLR